MTTTTLTQYLTDNISKYFMNPSSIKQTMLNGLSMALNGADIVDASNPFIFTLESGCVATAVAIAKSEALTRKQYKALSQNITDLFPHMSDLDYVGIFGIGSTCRLNFLIPYNQLKLYGIELIPNTGIKTVIIPRDTQINVNGITLQLGYPIIINVLPNNSVQVYYDVSIDNPLIGYETNNVPYSFINFNGGNYLQFELPAIQVSSFTKQFTLGGTSSFSTSIPFLQNFSYARAFMNTGNNVWTPMITTFSDMVYDINKPTLLFGLSGNNLTITLPDIYQTLNLISNSIRVDVFTTQGFLEVDLTQITAKNFSAIWNNFDNLNTINLSAIKAINVVNDIIISATTALTGGSNPLSFDQVYKKVVYNADATIAPVLPSDIISKLSAYGYSTEILINQVSNRIYLASKNLPANTINSSTNTINSISSPLTVNNNVTININDYPLNNVNSPSVIVHSSARATILPSALFVLSNGNASILTDDQINQINDLVTNKVALSELINSNLYMSTPFHYILDYGNPVFTGRVYYLNKPTVPNRSLIAQNTLRLYNIATMTSSIKLVGNNYQLTLTAAIPNNLPNVYCQLSYNDLGSNSSVYLTAQATVQSNQAIFVFNIETNFDINTLNQLELINFVNKNNIIEPLFTDLTTTFNLIYLVPGNKTGLTTNFDNLYITPIDVASTGVIGATQETITINFGQQLPNLYCPTYETLRTGSYLKYTSDVPATYNKTIYLDGPEGPAFTVDSNNKVQLNILHHIGDPILDINGNPTFFHRQGDPILDINGNMIPVPNSLNSVSYLIGITLIDAKYKYATNLSTINYYNSLIDILLGYLNNDIKTLSSQLFGDTKLWYKPSGESFSLKVNLGNGIISQIPGILNIEITVYMNEDGLNNVGLKTITTNSIKQAIMNQLKLNVITISGLEQAIQAILPPQASTFSIDSYLPNNVPIVTLLDTTQSFSIGSKLELLPDNSLDVVDSIIVLYKSTL